MPVNNKQIKITKIPLNDSDRISDYPKNFQSSPLLYLELIENKSKIKQDLINKPYVPDLEEKKKGDIEEVKEKKKGDIEEVKEKKKIKKTQEKFVEKFISRKDSELSSTSSSSKTISRKDSESSTSTSSSKTISRKDSENSQKTSNVNKIDSDDLSERLKELLEESKEENENRSVSKYKSYEKFKLENIKKNIQQPPTLAQLEQQGQYIPPKEIRDINNIPKFEKDEEDKKRELMFKFELLKKSYSNSQNVIPEYTIHSDLTEMSKTYDITVKKLSLDSTVENYKTYLTGGFMVVEYAFGNFLGFDMQGFTQQQIINMSSYEKLLIELGEKSYVPEGSDWPVEIRLLFIIIINAAIFIVSKIIMKKTGANILNMVNSVKSPTQTNLNKQKRKMKGPEINISQIPDTK